MRLIFLLFESLPLSIIHISCPIKQTFNTVFTNWQAMSVFKQPAPLGLLGVAPNPFKHQICCYSQLYMPLIIQKFFKLKEGTT